ncbi:putative fatty acyl-CoA reductase CG5065 [Odontomachus brunneus]|uniref:putative fatty acyl-CoA reductase CG5065 n=1 Tax=Odontomachus brunneus TaxID=486640 RepID=UPI0013F226E0|nr:putative fatty acyl-CoA reductase CG5065 [Odontomachus brunneus]XP_032666764.1 putative fatty acyl-CoA reductase CG5065 [Odontomachus brunneus]
MSVSDSLSMSPIIPIPGQLHIYNNGENNEISEKCYSTDKKSELPTARNPATCEKIPNTVNPKKKDGLNVNKTRIQQFYSGQTIFITGGSGFLGKILIEKLLRACTDITTIYVLLRSKTERDVEDRLNDIFQNMIYDRLKAEVPNFRSKIVPIKGDLSVANLGLSRDDDSLLKQNVSIVFHMGANVRFKEEFKSVAMTNINGTKYILDMAKDMKNLKAFIYVSALNANCYLKHNEEIFYPCPITYQTFLTIVKNLKPGEVSEQIAEAFSAWPNTYTITKAVAESLVKEVSEELPIGIFRPGTVISTADEPLAGWVGNYYGPMGLVKYIYKRLIKYIWCDPNCVVDLVPVDKTINALIVAAWDVSNKPDRRGIETLIYNYVSSNDAPITWGQYFQIAKVIGKKYPLEPWLLTVKLIKKKSLYKTRNWFTYTLPAILLDKLERNTNKRSLQKLYNKLYQDMENLGYFMVREWTYANYNVQSMWHRLYRRDQHLFNFDMTDFNWQEYLENHFKGILIYLFNEDLDILKVNGEKLKK